VPDIVLPKNTGSWSILVLVMIANSINFALKIWHLSDYLCEICSQKCAKLKPKEILLNKGEKEKFIHCFIKQILELDYEKVDCNFTFKEIKHKKHNIQRENIRLLSLNYPVDLVLDKSIPLEIKISKTKNYYLGNKAPFNLSLILLLPGEHATLSQYFTDLLKLIRLISIANSVSSAYLLFFSYYLGTQDTGHSNYLWDTLQRFKNVGNIFILSEPKARWHNEPIWGALSFQIESKIDDEIIIKIVEPKISFFDYIIAEFLLLTRNRFFSFSKIYSILKNAYWKQYNDKRELTIKISKQRFYSKERDNRFLIADLFTITKRSR